MDLFDQWQFYPKQVRLQQLRAEVDRLMERARSVVAEARKAKFSAAERQARTSEQFKKYLRKMHDARHEANMAKIEMMNKDRLYWHSVNIEANERAEKRMVR